MPHQQQLLNNAEPELDSMERKTLQHQLNPHLLPAYHDIIVAKGTGTLRAIMLHVVDALALVHALILRLQALVLPFQTLIFSGH